MSSNTELHEPTPIPTPTSISSTLTPHDNHDYTSPLENTNTQDAIPATEVTTESGDTNNEDEDDEDENDETAANQPNATQQILTNTEQVMTTSATRVFHVWKTFWNIAEIIVIIVILAKYYHVPCDRVGLRRYLVLRCIESFLLLPLQLAASFRKRTSFEYFIRVIIHLYTLAITIYGIVELARSHTCQHTNRAIWGTTIAMIITSGFIPLIALLFSLTFCVALIVICIFFPPPKPKSATKKQIRQLKQVTYDDTIKSQLKTHQECPICMCEFENDEKLHLLPCGHAFHVPCSTDWFVINRTCPECRADPFQKNPPQSPNQNTSEQLVNAP